MKSVFLTAVKKLWKHIPSAIKKYIKIGKFLDDRVDRQLGIVTNTVQNHSSQELATLENPDATICTPTTYHQLIRIFDFIQPQESDTLVDLGSGTGRVCFFYNYHFNAPAIGVEFDQSVFDQSLKNKKTFKGDSEEVKFFNMDAAKYSFEKMDILFLFNPFGRATMKTVLDNIHHWLKTQNDKKIKIVYVRTFQSDVLKQQSWLKEIPIPQGLTDDDILIFESI